MYHLRKLKSLLLLLLVAVTAKAQLSDGKVYNFVNVGKGTSMSITANDVIVTLPDERKYSQLWYAASEGNGFTLRNLANGHYLKSPNARSEAWSTVKVKDGNCIFTATPVGGNYAIAVSGKGGYNYMHADGGNTIVCWESSDDNSQWTMNVVDIDAATLNTNWNELASIDPSAATVATYQTHLDNLFSDKACTTLKKSFASENAVKNDADYKALPATLQEMVLKVYKNSWAEANCDDTKPDWDADYAKKYRVQLYEPYNEPEAAASALGLNAHTNLNNPTGIFANDREALYVMVGGEIETGASLYLVSYTGNGELSGYNDGYELKWGLNIIPSFGDGNNYCINYVVHTFDTSKGKGNKAKAYRLSDFDDLKIHIEGGYINGYWNKLGDELYLGSDGNQGDTAADWDYVESRATQTTVTILGEYITLQFPLYDAMDSGGNMQKGMSHYLDQVSVEDVINEWDKVMIWERLVLGVLDEGTTKAEAKKSPYSDKDYVFEYTGADNDGFESGYGDYYNVHGLSLGIPNSYMYGGWRFCGYNYGTMNDIMVNILTNAGAHWGPGHEIGHQHQNLLTVNGLTEVTNNLFANVVLWYYGETTSRVNGDEGSLSHVLAAFNTEGSDFFTNNIWALTHMYYKLFLYYHVLGHNTKFYPRLFEMLRQDPMSGGYNQNGATSLLHFYKKCCLASGEDLTEFFRAYGFFSVMDNRLVGDYDNSVYTTTQADIDAAIKDVKDLGYDKNIAVLFINDATGETIKSHKGDNLDLYGETRVCAEVGGYASFADNTTPNYTYSVSGTTVTMEGEGGTGFAIFNERGEIIAFSDKKTFTISEECAVALASGKAEVMAVKADNTPVEVVDVMDTDNTEAKYAALGELLNAVKAVTDLADATGTKVGYYRTDLLTDLQDAYETAKTVYDNETVASYNAVYDVLYQEYANVIADDFARIGIIEGNAYRLKNRAYTDRSMAVNTSNNQMSGVTTANTDEQKWYFEASNSLGRYYLKNKSTSLYPGDVSSGTVLSADKAADTKGNDKGAYAYELRDMGNGLWALVGSKGLHCSSSQSYNIVGWGADAEASQWYITAVEVDQNAETLYELQTLINRIEVLVDEMATVQYAGAVDMSTVTITSNATEDGHETKYLLDGNAGTYFHTVWASSSVGEPHYLQVDLGEAKSLSEFVWTYTTYTTDWNADLPAKVKVTGSADNQLWSDIATLTDLPSAKGTDYKSAVLGSSNQNFRYLRFTVTATSTGGKVNGQYYFGLGEMGLTRMSTFVESIGDKYANFITAEKVATVCDQVYAAQQTIALGSATSNDVAALQTQYDILLEAHQKANNVEFNAKREELLALINSTNSLISTCGTINYIPATLDGELELQTTDSNDSWYVSTNADQNTGGGTNDGQGIAALVDNNTSTSNPDNYFHTRWGGTVLVNEDHYIQVDMGAGVAINDFVFSYMARNGSPAPTEIKIKGSNDGSKFVEITSVTKNWGNYNENGIYTSGTIVSDEAYRYLRFEVTKSNGPGNEIWNGHYFFGMREFYLTAVGRPESYTAELGAQAGEATTDLLLATFHAANEAQDVYDQATTERQVNDAIAALQVKYDALYSAMYPDVEYTISSNAANGGVIYKGNDYTTTLSAPTTLTVGELTAIDLENEGYVAKSVTLNGRTITVTYNKVYNVQVVGVDAAGGVTLGETDYHVGDTINMLESEFDVKDFIAIPVTGYAAYKEFDNNATITVTYKKIYTVNVVGVAGQGGVVFESNNYTDALELHALNLEIGNLKAMPLTGYVANVALEGTTITVTYMKKYTVCLYGEEGTGVISYDNQQYENGDFIIVLGNIDESLIGVLGDPIYYYESVEVDHDLGTISVYYTFDKSDVANYEESSEQLISDAAGVLDETVIASFKDRIAEIRTQCDNASSYTVYSAALSDWATANNDFATAIETAKTAAVEAARNELRALIEQTTKLIAQCGTVEYTTTIDQVALQTGDPNADFWLSTNAQESSEGAIANLLKETDFFHSSWSTQVGAAHYLQVDMGAENSLKEFAFSYTTRDNNDGGPHPSTIVVSGSNSTSNDSFVELATINSGLPTNGNTAWNENNENVITASEAYRYLRFTVTASAGTNGCQHGNGEYYFAMARFSLNSISRGYTAELQNTNVTAEQLIAVYQANAAAATLADNSAVKEDLVAEKNSLQALYDALLEATLPVVLTTDTNVPALYVIKTKRDNNPVLQYDESSGMFSVTTAVDGKAIQAFYFMKGDKVEGTQQVYIYPYMAGGKVLAANDVDDGHSKALAMDKSTATYEQWVFVEQADGYYNLQPAGKSTYLSNYGGTGNKMGFYKYGPDTDKGSLFKFESTTVEGSYYYLKLKNYYETEVKVTGEIQGDNTAVGYYPVDQATAYNTAYAAATAALANTETTEVEYQTAYTDLVAANKALVMNMPVVGKYYVIRSANANNAYTGKLMSATEENAIWWNKGKTKEDPEALWTFTSDGYLESLHTGCAVNTTSGEAGLGDAPKVISIKSISGDGQVLLTPEGGYPLHADQFGHVVGWGTYDAGSASAWRIEEVGHVAKIGTYNYTSLYLNYPTTIPADVEAYIAKNVKKEADEEYATIDLVKLNGNVLPAQTGVILYSATPGDYNFLYTANEATDNVYENLLEGSDRVQYIGDETGTYKYYIFGRSGGEVGLYWAKMDYNADGTSVGGTDRGNYFKASANKVYLKLKVQPETALSGFRFRIGNEVTGLEDVTIGADTIIYDLYGRRILEVVTPGLYIINGEKRYINIK